MSALLMPILRSRSFAVCVHAALWLLVILAIVHLGGKPPEFREATAFSLPPQTPVPVSKLGSLFTTAEWPRPFGGTNNLNPFFTRYFQPPAPPPVTTRKIEMTYQGFYETGESPKIAVLKVADSFVIAREGCPIAPLATNLFVAQATMQSVLLTNLSAQTNLLFLNAKKEIEVPTP